MPTEAELVQQWTPQIHALAMRHRGQGIEYDDLVQIGMLGLVKALRSFNPSKPMGLQSWICLIAENEMFAVVRHLRRAKRTAKLVPLAAAELLTDDLADRADDGDIWEVLYRVRDELTDRERPVFFAWLGTSRCGPLNPTAVARRYGLHRRVVLEIIAKGLRLCRDRLGIEADLRSFRIGKSQFSIAG